MGARGRITIALALSFQSYHRTHHRGYTALGDLGAALLQSEKRALGSGFSKSETRAVMILAVHLRDTSTHMTRLLEEKRGTSVC